MKTRAMSMRIMGVGIVIALLPFFITKVFASEEKTPGNDTCKVTFVFDQEGTGCTEDIVAIYKDENDMGFDVKVNPEAGKETVAVMPGEYFLCMTQSKNNVPILAPNYIKVDKDMEVKMYASVNGEIIKKEGEELPPGLTEVGTNFISALQQIEDIHEEEEKIKEKAPEQIEPATEAPEIFDEDPEEGTGSKMKRIAGIVVAVTILVVIGFCLYLRKKDGKNPPKTDGV